MNLYELENWSVEMGSTSERNQLEEISRRSIYAVGANAEMIRYCYGILRRHLVPGSVLELGPAEGLMSRLLAEDVADLTLVDGSAHFCEQLSSALPKAKVVNALFEEFAPVRRFDNIVLGHVLEHVEDPVDILRRVKVWLEPGRGRVFAAVPNSRSLHRQAAVIMRLLSHEAQLNDRDRAHGHRRVFDPEGFRNVFAPAGLRIEHFGGYWLKPVSIPQIESHWTPEMLDAFMQLGERYPDIAGEIYVVARSDGI